MPKVETFNRDIVIKQATDVFHEKGFNATSMQDLVDATGLNRSSIYNSFENKHSMFLECLNAYQNIYKSKISQALLKANTSIEAIEFIFNLYLNNSDKRGCFIVNCKSEMANQDKPITNFLAKNQNEFLELLEDIIIKGQNELVINNNQNSHDYALYLYSSIQGFRTTSIMISDKNHLKSILKTIIQTLR